MTVTVKRDVDEQLRKSVPVLIAPGQTEEPMCALVGSWSSCDVYLQSAIDSTSPWPLTTLRLYGKDEGVRALLQQQQPQDVPAVQLNGDSVAQLVLSVRDHPCDEFYVTATRAAAGPPIVAREAKLVMEVWASNRPARRGAHDVIEIAMALPTSLGSGASGPNLSQWTPLAKRAAVWRATGVNIGGAVAFLGLYDSDVPLVGAEVPVAVEAVAPNGSADLIPPKGLRVRKGITLALSTVPDRFTAYAFGSFSVDFDDIS